MGMLIGNTTVIEHAGTYVEWSRTYSHTKFQPIKAHIGFVVPKGITLADAYLLAKGIVNAQLGLGVHLPRRVNELCQLVFECSLLDLLGDEPGETKLTARKLASMLEESYQL